MATAHEAENDRMIDIAIRFDDPSAISDHALERALLDSMATYTVRATFAVIPCAEQRSLLATDVPHLVDAQQRGTLEIAQHGFSHDNATSANALPSEFAGIDAASQSAKITQGRTVLEQAFGVSIKGFVPPFNTFDRHTAAVLADQGFDYLSAGSEHGIIESKRLAPLPRTCQITEIKVALDEARRRPFGKLAIIAVMHHYDFREFGQADAPLNLPDFADLLRWLQKQSDVRLNTLTELTARHTPATWQQALKRNQWVERQHWRIRALFPRYSLMPRPLFNYVRLTESPT
jgi:predicted deacetylase